MSQSNYFVVTAGHKSEVYKDWNTAEKQIKEHAYPYVASFGDKESAEHYHKSSISGETQMDNKDSKIQIPYRDTTILSLNITSPHLSFGTIRPSEMLTYHWDILYPTGKHEIKDLKEVSDPNHNKIGYYYLIAIRNVIQSLGGKIIIKTDNQYSIDCISQYNTWNASDQLNAENASLIAECLSMMKDRDITVEGFKPFAIQSCGCS